MKKVINVSLAGRNFTLNEDAYNRLQAYLDHFKAKLTVPDYQKAEVMEEIEGRIAELFFDEVGAGARVITLEMAEKVIAELGMPDGSAEYNNTESAPGTAPEMPRGPRRLYRDLDNKAIGGVCSGLSYYFDIDVTIFRILMLVAFICGSAGFWIYVILWIAVPKAVTPAQKCEMRGIPATAENMSKFATSK
ncbi:MAG: PspC domain-containing protein [Bacteroidales bacterium]|nr:PspC domain-containing protein [Bacteroidales bacterium]